MFKNQMLESQFLVLSVRFRTVGLQNP